MILRVNIISGKPSLAAVKGVEGTLSPSAEDLEGGAP